MLHPLSKAFSKMHNGWRVPEVNMAGILINEVTSCRRDGTGGAPVAAETWENHEQMK